jgi:uncharacterized protein YjiS (DUF1127 family)
LSWRDYARSAHATTSTDASLLDEALKRDRTAPGDHIQATLNRSFVMASRIAINFPGVRGVPRAVSGGGLAACILAAVARWRQRRILGQLDERMLHDIGISRSQALAEARKPCWLR